MDWVDPKINDPRDSRSGRCGVMTSITNWSDRTDLPEPPQSTSPSRIIAGDDHIAECSDLFREAIQARNVYAAWARKLINARPNDPMLQRYHQEVTKAGENVELLVKLNVPLFFIPASEKELDDSLFLCTWTDKQSSIPYHDVCDAGLDFVGFFSLRSDMSAIWLW
ncbi:hypothetical protein TNCV_1493391 [Trichonephila clavipes]|nr:hypothetical protein TNCV_1493391 [Trichonephila clavipes]